MAVQAELKFGLSCRIFHNIVQNVTLEPEFALCDERLAQQAQVFFLGKHHMQAVHALQAFAPRAEESHFRLSAHRLP